MDLYPNERVQRILSTWLYQLQLGEHPLCDQVCSFMRTGRLTVLKFHSTVKPYREIIPQKLNDQSAVLVRIFIKCVQLSDSIFKRLPEPKIAHNNYLMWIKIIHESWDITSNITASITYEYMSCETTTMVMNTNRTTKNNSATQTTKNRTIIISLPCPEVYFPGLQRSDCFIHLNKYSEPLKVECTSRH